MNGATSTKNDPHSVDSESDLALVASMASKALRTMAVTCDFGGCGDSASSAVNRGNCEFWGVGSVCCNVLCEFQKCMR